MARKNEMLCQLEGRRLRNISVIVRNACFALALLVATAVALGSPAIAADDGNYKTVGGLSVYIGVVPAELVKGLPTNPPSYRCMAGYRPAVTSIMWWRQSST